MPTFTVIWTETRRCEVDIEAEDVGHAIDRWHEESETILATREYPLDIIDGSEYATQLHDGPRGD